MAITYYPYMHTIRAPFCTPFCTPFAHHSALHSPTILRTRVNTCRHTYYPFITHHTILSLIHSETVVHSFLSFISLIKEENIIYILFARNGYHILPIYALHSCTILTTIRPPVLTPAVTLITLSLPYHYTIILYYLLFIRGTVVHSFLSFISLTKEENIISILCTSFVHVMAITTI